MLQEWTWEIFRILQTRPLCSTYSYYISFSSSNEPSTSTTPRFLTPMQQTNQESKPQLRSNVVFYTDEDLGYSSESPDYCFKIPPVLAHSLMSEEGNNHCLPDRYMIRRPPLTVAQMKTFSVRIH